MKVKGVLLNVKSYPGRVDTVEIEEGDLNKFYSALDCSTIDIVKRFVGDGNKQFNFVCDDEALLKDNATASAYSSQMQEMLFGNLFICNNYKEHLVSLSEDDIAYIQDNIRVLFNRSGDKENKWHVFPVIINVKYV